ncbi:hypothetical protein [Streptomyces sp. NPDC001275]
MPNYCPRGDGTSPDRRVARAYACAHPSVRALDQLLIRDSGNAALGPCQPFVPGDVALLGRHPMAENRKCGETCLPVWSSCAGRLRMAFTLYLA